MKVEIIGNRCITCGKYTQYYSRNYDGGWDAIDCGYCGQKSRNVRPGDRCSYYHERSNVGVIFGVPLKAAEEEAKRQKVHRSK
ncbi:MAG: hypothetical protein Q4E91_06245 [Lachnospiraceae bacterium]|nr:hypothetical protein [Lachnospiraceae bacterium]